MILFFKRKALGLGSVRGIQQESEGQVMWRNHTDMSGSRRFARAGDALGFGPVSMVVRWGCTATLPPSISSRLTGQVFDIPSDVPVLNTAQAISRVGNKLGFVQQMKENNIDPMNSQSFSSRTSLGSSDPQFPLILRPMTHAQGRNVVKCNDYSELEACLTRPCFRDGWYARPFVNKVKEYRVYVMHGRVVTVAEKTPENPSAIAWNVAQGGRFDVVRWDDWPIHACDLAIKAFHLSGLDFSGVDVMLDEEGQAYVIELNSAPSLPFNSDGSTSYRHKVMAKAFKWVKENGKETEETGTSGWRDVIHPSIWPR